MCKIDVEFCNAPDREDHIEQMIEGLREAAPDDDNDYDGEDVSERADWLLRDRR